ncbi:hypothetical protein [Azospirillum sp. B506]|uniref:hypothetical protein n=1 Tax=Azospirillum sp. B506 TaxID=137721 RepID=UPI0005B2785A|nr:hypothetical protein [Azospirillum sp. B506]
MLGAIAFLAAILVVAYQAVMWLKTGAWPHVTFLTWAGPEFLARTEWIGFNNLINGALDTNAAVVLVILAMMLWMAEGR